jgi:cytochrome c biogenesis protein CcmG/thiol:disulfide interchange protein DsbE
LVLGRLAGVVAAFVIAFGGQAWAKAPKVGEVAPDFEAELLDGSKVTLADYRGQVLVINLWATWCAPCRNELPLLDAYYKHQRVHGLKMIAVTTQNSAPISKIKPVFKILELPAARRLKGPYKTHGPVPMNFVIDRAGVVRYAKVGAFDLDTLNNLLVPLLKEPAPPLSSVASAAP